MFYCTVGPPLPSCPPNMATATFPRIHDAKPRIQDQKCMDCFTYLHICPQNMSKMPLHWELVILHLHQSLSSWHPRSPSIWNVCILWWTLPIRIRIWSVKFYHCTITPEKPTNQSIITLHHICFTISPLEFSEGSFRPLNLWVRFNKMLHGDMVVPFSTTVLVYPSILAT